MVQKKSKITSRKKNYNLPEANKNKRNSLINKVQKRKKREENQNKY